MILPDPPPPDAAGSAHAGLADAMRQLHAAFERIEGQAARRLGLARSDLACLRLLQSGAATPREIGARLELTSGSVTALVDRLEAKGMVERRPDPRDRRGVLVAPTALATYALDEAYAPLHQAAGRLEARYGPERSAAAVRQLGDLARLCDWMAARIGAP